MYNRKEPVGFLGKNWKYHKAGDCWDLKFYGITFSILNVEGPPVAYINNIEFSEDNDNDVFKHFKDYLSNLKRELDRIDL